MKITHVISELIAGGGERVAVELANGAVKAGHQVSLIVSFPEYESVILPRVDNRVMVQYVSGRKLPILLRYLNVIRFIRLNDWVFTQDVIHVHLTFGAVFGVLVKFWTRFFCIKKPIVVETYHSVGMPMPKWRRWFRDACEW